jgi:hypothetical protein
MTNCGACQESCCASQEVPGGPFYRTYSNAGSGATGEADPATVSNFRLDKYLVTVGRFRQFVTAWNNGSGWKPGASAGKHAYLNGGSGLVNAGSGGGYESGWLASDDANVSPTDANLACGTDGWTNTPAGQETLPIGCVNWWEAYAFCIWDGGFLPSEAEVAYAEAGGADQREYPWGSASPGTASQYAMPGNACEHRTRRNGGPWQRPLGPPRPDGRRSRVGPRLGVRVHGVHRLRIPVGRDPARGARHQLRLSRDDAGLDVSVLLFTVVSLRRRRVSLRSSPVMRFPWG